MKTVIQLTACLLIVASSGHAQSYSYIQTTGTISPYFERYYQNVIMAPTSDEVLSAWQPLPFAWNFYGQPVTGYYASDNGYITFDSLATTSVSANDLPPTVAGPNNAIYAFWDALRIINYGLTDKIVTSTYGTAPARVHVIQWFSVTPSAQSSTLYFAIRLYECGDFDIIFSLCDGSGRSGTIGCENVDGTAATVIPGSPSLGFPTLAAGGTDDVVYRFYEGTQPTYDLRMMTSTTDRAVAAGNSVNVTGTVENNGSTTVTAFDLNYAVNGGGTVTANVSGVSIPGGGHYTYTHTTPYQASSAGHHRITAWVSNPNGQADLSNCNDSMKTVLAATTGVSGNKRVLMEEFTGAWCQFCPDGRYYIDSLQALYPGLIVASIHGGGGTSYPMEFPSGVEIAAAFCPFYPAGAVDRIFYNGETMVGFTRDLWFSRTLAETSATTPVNVSINTVYDADNRVLDATVDADFVDYASDNLRLSVYVTEDSVTGTGTGYNQVNYYNNIPGHPYYGAGNPIIGYVHEHVLRLALPATWGDPDVITDAPGPSGHYSHTYSGISIPASWDADQLHIVAFVSYGDADLTRRQVLNANEFRVYDGTVISGIAQGGVGPTTLQLLCNYPNPFNPTTSIRYELPFDARVSLKIYNILGQEVRTLVNGYESAGFKNVSWDGKDRAGHAVTSGIYIYRLSAGDKTFSRKMLLVK